MTMPEYIVYTVSGTFVARVQAVDGEAAITAGLGRVNGKHQHVQRAQLRALEEAT